MTLRVFVINDFVLYNEFTACKEEVRFFYCLFGVYEQLSLPSHYIQWYHKHKKKVMLVFLYMSEANKHSRRDENQDRFF